MVRVVRLVAVVSTLAAGVLFAACSDDGGASDDHAGAAAAAVTQFYSQERDGGRLPEGTTGIVSRGVKTNSVVELDVTSDHEAQSIEARYCMEYQYIAETVAHTRVYVAQLIEGAWDVEAVKADGTCEGVT